MPQDSLETLPEALKTLRTRPLFAIHIDVRRPILVGVTPTADRRVGILTGGRFEGERLRGEVLDGGMDWQTVRSDGAWTMDVRSVLKTDDGALIGMIFHGLRSGPHEVLERLGRGEPVDPASYYNRIALFFETASPKYDWLNRILAVAVGHRLPDGPIYNVFEIL